jgi:hypothetical protein
MRAILFAVVVLAGCQSDQLTVAEEIQQYGGQCQAYGFKPGSDAYANCVLQFHDQQAAADRQRRVAAAAFVANAGQSMSDAYKPAPTMNCTSQQRLGTVYTSCN